MPDVLTEVDIVPRLLDAKAREAAPGAYADPAGQPGRDRIARETDRPDGPRAVFFHDSFTRPMLYVAEPFPGIPGVPAGVLRLALPVSSLRGELGRLRVTLLWVLGLVFVAGGLVAYGLARSMVASLRLVRGLRFWVWMKSGNLSGSRIKKTGVLLPTRS